MMSEIVTILSCPADVSGQDAAIYFYSVSDKHSSADL